MIVHEQITEPHRRLWTKEEYYRLADLGFFTGQKVELIEGDIVIQYANSQKELGLPYPSDAPHSRLWTKAEYYRLGDLGFFDAMKAELIEGEIVVTSPPNWLHYSEVDRVADVARNAPLRNVWVRTQAPLDLGLIIEPEPDVSVVSGHRQDYTAHPTSALLVVEVSESTLAYDLGDKSNLYAAGGISDYWVVNLVDERLEVFRSPVADASSVHGHRYTSHTVLSRSDRVTLLAFPTVSIAVADLLP